MKTKQGTSIFAVQGKLEVPRAEEKRLLGARRDDLQHFGFLMLAQPRRLEEVLQFLFVAQPSPL